MVCYVRPRGFEASKVKTCVQFEALKLDAVVTTATATTADATHTTTADAQNTALWLSPGAPHEREVLMTRPFW